MSKIVSTLKTRSAKNGLRVLLKPKQMVMPIVFAILLMSCASQNKQKSDLKDVYYGSSINETLVPTSNGKSISCSSLEFDEMVCLRQEDFFEHCLMRRCSK